MRVILLAIAICLPCLAMDSSGEISFDGMDCSGEISLDDFEYLEENKTADELLTWTQDLMNRVAELSKKENYNASDLRRLEQCQQEVGYLMEHVSKLGPQSSLEMAALKLQMTMAMRGLQFTRHERG